jgi:hypothetical protein
VKASDRKHEVLRVMHEIYAKAHTQDDFTATKIARVISISTVWFYRLVGQEFIELRSQLPGSRKPKEATIGKLKKLIKELRAQIRTLNTRLKNAAFEETAEAIRMIERLDDENRSLRADVVLLRRRLDQREQVIIPQYQDLGYRILRSYY